MSSKERYEAVRAQVEQCALAAGRNPQDVLLIGVSKTVGVPEVKDAIAAGAHNFGENRPELLCEKAMALPDEKWHFIGNVQSRAIPRIVEHACLIHSVYQEKHIHAIDRAAQRLDKVQDILIEVNVSGEESKGGCAPEEALSLVQVACACEHVRPCGLMTMAPQGDTQVARETFEGLAALRASIAAQLSAEDAAHFDGLSMGMSEDWQEAIAAGATMIRIGRAIFSDAFAL